MNEFLSAAAGAAIGVLLTYIFDIRKAARERRDSAEEATRQLTRSREATATALLFDLKRLEFDLRQMYESQAPTRAVTYEPPLFYKSLHSEMRWFSPGSIQPIAEFFRRAEHFYMGLAAYRELARGTQQHTAQQDYKYRCYAAFALQALPAAVGALQKEGGVVPAPIDWYEYTYPDLPTIPDRVFRDNIVTR